MDPADDHNQLVGIETFFQRNANHSYATRGNTECGKTGPETMSRITMSPAQGQPSQIRSIDHFCAAKDCFRMDPTHFRSTRHLTKDKTFLDRAGLGFSGIPVDLFKQAPTPFQGRIHLLVNEILEGKFDCDQDLLMANVILIHKDKDIAILDHYRPIALLNTIY